MAVEYDLSLLEAVEDELIARGVDPYGDLGATDDWRLGDWANPDTGAGESGGGLVHELVKSYGFRKDQNPETGAVEWTWSFENIGKSFQEDPVWTSLDYLLAAVPLARIGKAVHAVSSVSKGTSVAKRAYQRGQLAGEGAKTLRGKAVQGAARVFGSGSADRGIGRAAELEMKFGLPRTPAGRVFSNSMARRIDDPEWDDLVAKAGGLDPFEERAVFEVFTREMQMASEAVVRDAEELIRTQNNLGLSPSQLEELGEIYSRGLRTGPNGRVAPEVAEEILEKFGNKAGAVTAFAQRSNQFRLAVHQKAFQLGLLDTEQYAWGLEHYWPRVWEGLDEGAREAVRRGEAFVSNRGSLERFTHARRLSQEAAAAIHADADDVRRMLMDPSVGLAKLAEAGKGVMHVDYLHKLGTSHLSATWDEVGTRVARAVAGDFDDDLTELGGRALIAQIGERNADAIAKAVSEGSEEAVRLAIKDAGWMSLDETLKAVGGKKYLERLRARAAAGNAEIAQILDRYIDPIVANDMKGMVRFHEAVPEFMRGFYLAGMSHFKASKTAYNPATHMRNLFGAAVFHHLSVGGAGIFDARNPFFAKGRAALRAAGGQLDASTDEGLAALKDWQDALGSGLVNTSFVDAEILEAAARAGVLNTEIGARQTGVDWMLKVAKLRGVQKATRGLAEKAADKVLDTAAWAERKYRFIDEMAKIDAFIVRRDAHIARLKRTAPEMAQSAIEAEAIKAAAVDVAKFQPVFAGNSQFTKIVRDVVPFGSFTTEAARIWKNALQEKPHLVFFYNHLVEGMSHMAGAAAGFSPDDLAAAESAMPEYVQGKKMLVMPFRINGKPTFLDMSYMLPMANMGTDVTEEGASIFERIGLNPFASNPFLALSSAVAFGIDPFSKRKISPDFMERQLGVDVPERGPGRTFLGLGEYMAKMALPPWAPPGYAGVNLWEALASERHPISGEPLEEGVARTVAANLAGFRTYEADVEAALRNTQRERRRIQEELTVQWNRQRWAHVNGRVDMQESALKEIRALKRRLGSSPDEVEKYVEQGLKRREPGKWRGVSTKEIEGVFEKTRKYGIRSEEDLRMLTELTARYHERIARTRAGKQYLQERASEHE